MYSKRSFKYFEKLNLKKEQLKLNKDAVNKIISCDNLKDQYSVAYDLICDYLDNKFQGCDYCEFKDDTCVYRRLLAKEKGVEPLKNGCCFSLRYQKNCQYLGEHGCTIRNVACKLHCCRYLRKKGIKYSLKDIYFTKYLLNPWQKYYLSTTFFKPKEFVLKGLYRRRSRFIKFK